MQEIGEQSAIQYVQSFEIDSRNWIWILDVGRLNFLSQFPNETINSFGKLLIWDLNNNCLLREYVFPNYVSSTNNSFLNDIVVDETNGLAYMTETMGDGGIVVYDFKKNEARRWNDKSLGGNNTNTITINSISYSITNPSDGIALSHDTTTLYYCSLSREQIFSVPTKYLQNFQLKNEEISQHIVLHGVKGYSDGMSFSSNGNIYFGSLAENSVYEWNPNTPLSQKKLIYQNNSTNQWQDTFAWGNDGYLYWTSNKLELYIFRTMNFSSTEPNFRIWKSFVNGNSYLTGNPIPLAMNCVVNN
eukprot:TRINITY_DN5745_c0_g2_i1.p1 TRINITY_DN5745_c0_g2~~TRINITY_DN5745_c0_g2_i1.p1  ORF type:complete len:302 (-),score=89.36 TRINITY_DN5745_c0_g2_i1:48-953(-)